MSENEGPCAPANSESSDLRAHVAACLVRERGWNSRIRKLEERDEKEREKNLDDHPALVRMKESLDDMRRIQTWILRLLIILILGLPALGVGGGTALVQSESFRDLFIPGDIPPSTKW